MSLFDLTGKVAIITGSSRGIGRAIADALADQGAKVVISSRKVEACVEAAEAINRRHGEGRAIVVPANISSKDDLQRLMDETRKAFGKIDILVCNAASNPFYGSQLDIPDEAFRKILEVVIGFEQFRHGSPQEIRNIHLHGPGRAIRLAGHAIPAFVVGHVGLAGHVADPQHVKRTDIDADGAAFVGDALGLVDDNRNAGLGGGKRHGLRPFVNVAHQALARMRCLS